VSAPATLAEAVLPLRADPARAAILLDVDGTLAPIVQDPNAARVPDATRALLARLATGYGLVACVSGRRAATARAIVSLESITYVGNHGAEVLHAGAVDPEPAPGLEDWARRVRAFADAAFTSALRAQGVREEDKDVIVAFHWRGAPDEDAAEAAVRDVEAAAKAGGLVPHWGRKVLEIRPPVAFDKGLAAGLLLQGAGMRTALYAGDDRTDVDAFRALRELVAAGELEHALCVGVRDTETPPEITDEADLLVDGTAGVDALLGALGDG
jgi:trehalose 6-phosphate phosphatase